MSSQRVPLLPEGELNDAANIQLVTEFVARLGQSCGFALSQFPRPLVPAILAIEVAEHIKQDEVFQPPAILFAKAIKPLPISAGCAFQEIEEITSRFDKQRHLRGAYFFVINQADMVRQVRDSRRID